MPPQAQAIPSPLPMTISPGMFAAYGALVAAAVLMILYLYRGRAFVVYWIGSWLLVAGSMMLVARGYDDIRLGSVVLGLAQLLGVWSAGLMLLAAEAFPDDPLRWTTPLKVAAATAVWFLAGPWVLPLNVMLSTGPALAAILFGWAVAAVLPARTAHAPHRRVRDLRRHGADLCHQRGGRRRGVRRAVRRRAVQPPADLQHRAQHVRRARECSCWCSRT